MPPAPALIERVRQISSELLQSLVAIEAGLEASEQPGSVYPQLAAAMDECVLKLSALNIWGPDNRLPSSELWNVAGHLLCRGWLQNQARTKPRGYAGDYEMLARIYKNDLCDDPLGQLFDRYFQVQAAPQAVRNRMAMITDWIIQSASRLHHSPLTTHHLPKIVIVGSAFGMEIRDALLRLDQSARERISVALLDLDPSAIDFARVQLGELLPLDRLTATSANVFRLPDRPQTAALLREADLLFCPGLFDYLDDAAAAEMLCCLFEQLAPGGRLTFFQFAPHNPTRTYMEWLGNWYLTYRDAAHLRKLVTSAGLAGASVTFGADPLGVDLYAMITRL